MVGIARMKHRKMKQAKRRRVIKNILSVAFIIFLCFLIIGMAKGKDRNITGYEYQRTDTLWGLLEYCPNDMDRWEYLDIVMEINNMSDRTIQANRLYQVPIFE